MVGEQFFKAVGVNGSDNFEQVREHLEEFGDFAVAIIASRDRRNWWGTLGIGCRRGTSNIILSKNETHVTRFLPSAFIFWVFTPELSLFPS